jgi:hypothetical protein
MLPLVTLVNPVPPLVTAKVPTAFAKLTGAATVFKLPLVSKAPSVVHVSPTASVTTAIVLSVAFLCRLVLHH